MKSLDRVIRKDPVLVSAVLTKPFHRALLSELTAGAAQHIWALVTSEANTELSIKDKHNYQRREIFRQLSNSKSTSGSKFACTLELSNRVST